MKSTLILFLIVSAVFVFGSCQQRPELVFNSEMSFDSLFTKFIIGQDKQERILTISQFLEQNPLSDSTASFAYFALGYANSSVGNLDLANSNLRKSLSFLEDDEISEMKARNFYQLGYIALKKQQLYLANYYISQTAEMIISHQLQLKKPQFSAYILAMATNLNRHNKTYTNAIRYANAMINFHNEDDADFQLNIVTTQLNTANIYSNPSMQNPDSVDYYINYASQLKEDYKFSSEMLDRNTAYAKAEIFYNQEKFDSSLYYLNSIEIVNNYTQFAKNCNLIGLYAELGKLDSSRYYLGLADQHYKLGNESDILNYLENKTHYLILTNQPEKALVSFKELMAKKLDKEINENVKAVNELATVYSLQSKESKIKKLSKEVDAVQFTLERRNLYLIGLGVLLLFSIIAIAFGVSVSKRRKLELENERISALNNKVDLEQRLLRSQMNPHFIFNSLGAIQSFIRQEKKEESLSYLSLFSKLLRGNLESSRAKAITLESEVDLLENYLQLQQVRNPDMFFLPNFPFRICRGGKGRIGNSAHAHSAICRKRLSPWSSGNGV